MRPILPITHGDIIAPMYAILSPAKKLDFDGPSLHRTQPAFPEQTAMLAERCRALGTAGLKRTMKLSDKLAELNSRRFDVLAKGADPDHAKAAMFAFRGDTYIGLQADGFSKADVTYAQKHIGILSGLYGLLAPLDAMHPYRLEMGSRIKSDGADNLYDVWRPLVANAINKRAKGQKAVVNLASAEYFKAVDTSALKLPVITPVFKEEVAGASKVIGIYAKRARGAMARYIVENRITEPEGLKAWNEGGYRFNPSQSDETTLVFARPKV